MLQIDALLQAHPFLNASRARHKTGLSAPTVNKAFEALETLGIVGEITGKRGGRVFAHTAFLKILDKGTEGQPAAR